MIVAIGRLKRYLISENRNLNYLRRDNEKKMNTRQEFSNLEIETRDPNKLLVVTQAHIDKYPQHKALLEKYYDKRADRVLDPNFVESIRTVQAIIEPIKITHVDELDADVVLDGRQRTRGAQAVGLPEVPVIVYSDEADVAILLELVSNLARSDNTAVESAHAFRKAMAQGKTQEDIAKMIGYTPARVSQILTLGDMPPVVHDWVSKGKLSETAALSLKKTFGKPAAKATGLTALYDPKEVKAGLEAMEDTVRLAGGTKIKVKQAKASKPGHHEGLSAKEWDALIADAQVPTPYVALISLFRNQLSVEQARQQGGGELNWLRKITPQPKPKKVKEPKVKASKKGKGKDEGETTPVKAESKEDIKALFA